MSNSTKTALKKILGCIVLIAFILFGLQPAGAYAAVPKLDLIRVGLFFTLDRYQNNVSTVTLTSDQGFLASFKAPGSGKLWPISGGYKTVRGSLNEYRVLLSELPTLDEAKALGRKLEPKLKPVIYSVNRQGKTVYQIFSGSTYGAKAAADAALNEAKAMAAMQGAAPLVTGPYSWNAGSYGTEAEAAVQAQALAQTGIAAEVAVQEDAGGNPVYSVWLGQETDADKLDALKVKLAALFPALPLQPVDRNVPSFVIRSSLLETTNEFVPHYFVGNAGEKVSFTPRNAGAGTITVSEKSGASYRGSIEISQFNGQLAVINELPIEQYLYSVVGSEMAAGWPAEALKAQAVAARTFAVKQGNAYKIANVTDTTLDQAYAGTGKESADLISAVDATQGEILTVKDVPISALFYSNAGGKTADPSEVWGNPVMYITSVESPDDVPERSKPLWIDAVFADGRSGYVLSTQAKSTGEKNGSGLAYYETTSDKVSVRLEPASQSTPALFTVSKGIRFLSLSQVKENNAYSWQRGPFTSAKLLDKINTVAPGNNSIQSLEVTGKGPSGRVTEITVNGKPVKLKTSDSWRSIFQGLNSTLFDIEETGRYTILGAGGATRTVASTPGDVHVLCAGQTAAPAAGAQMFALNVDGQVRLVTKDAQFIFKGKGYGHGVGMSQWGARSLADQGYEYRAILLHYYSGVTISKG